MKHKLFPVLVTLSALVFVGCAAKEEASSTAPTSSSATSTAAPIEAVSYEKGSKKKGDMGVCAVCTVKDGKPTAEEEAKVVLDYKEKSYVFCNEAEEAEFISNPTKYAGE